MTSPDVRDELPAIPVVVGRLLDRSGGAARLFLACHAVFRVLGVASAIAFLACQISGSDAVPCGLALAAFTLAESACWCADPRREPRGIHPSGTQGYTCVDRGLRSACRGH